MKWGNWAKSKLHRVIIDVALRKPFFLYGCNIRYGTADSPRLIIPARLLTKGITKVSNDHSLDKIWRSTGAPALYFVFNLSEETHL